MCIMCFCLWYEWRKGALPAAELRTWSSRNSSLCDVTLLARSCQHQHEAWHISRYLGYALIFETYINLDDYCKQNKTSYRDCQAATYSLTIFSSSSASCSSLSAVCCQCLTSAVAQSEQMELADGPAADAAPPTSVTTAPRNYFAALSLAQFLSRLLILSLNCLTLLSRVLRFDSILLFIHFRKPSNYPTFRDNLKTR